jgi:2-methylisocitrate lyase-like PEP mutase family enzyme
MSAYETFLQLHQNSTPLLLGNIWDVNSAKVFERNGFKAIATSSAALANTFGYSDGEQLPFDDLLHLAKRVVQEVRIPFSVDIEGGYSRTAMGIAKNIEKLHDVGVVGVNLEDTLPTSQRQFQSPQDFGMILSGVTDYLSRKNLKIFLNVRTDGFLLGLPSALEETLNRIKIYEGCGVQGIFTPCIVSEKDIQVVVGATKLPINVMNMPTLPAFSELTQLGVRRISMGNSVHQFVTSALESKLQSIIQSQSF